MNLFRRPQLAVPVQPPVDVPVQVQAALNRAWTAEDHMRATQTRLDASIARERQLTQNLTHAVDRRDQLMARIVELSSEVTALRSLLAKATGTAHCPACRDPMPFGFAHYCRRTSEYREETAA